MTNLELRRICEAAQPDYEAACQAPGVVLVGAALALFYQTVSPALVLQLLTQAEQAVFTERRNGDA